MFVCVCVIMYDVNRRIILWGTINQINIIDLVKKILVTFISQCETNNRAENIMLNFEDDMQKYQLNTEIFME